MAHSSAVGREPRTSVMKAVIVLDKVPTPKESTLGSALACLVTLDKPHGLPCFCGDLGIC